MRTIDETAPRARTAKLWRVLVAGGVALATACAGMNKSSSSSGAGGDSGSQGTSGADAGSAKGGNGGGAGGW